MKQHFSAMLATIMLCLCCISLIGCENNLTETSNDTSTTTHTQESTSQSESTTSGTASGETFESSTAFDADSIVGTLFPGATTLPIFARFDFGTKTVAEDRGLTTHQYITSILTYHQETLDLQFTEDTLKITARKNGTFPAVGETATLSDSTHFLRGTNICYYPMSDFSINFDNLITYDFEDELRSGYGSFANYPFTFGNVGNHDAWRGYHQYMKLRIKNPTENNKIAMQFNNSVGYASTQFAVMSIGAGKDTFETYIYDLCYASTYPSGKGVLLAGSAPGNNWTWKQNTPVTGLRFHLLGSTCSYANAYLNNQFEKDESAADYDIYQEYFDRLDSRAMIREGATVEIDYIVFGSSPEELQKYHSYIESSSLAELREK